MTGPAGTSPISPADEFTYLVSSSTYSISLVAGTTAPAVGASVTLTAIANVDVGPTPYGMSIVDASTGVIVSRVGFGMTFSATVSQSTAMTQRYVAEIDNAGGVNIQANSSPVIVTWGGTPPPVPTVSNVNPATGPASGGTPVTVTGTNFAAGDTVAFGGSAETGVVVNSPTSITADAPPGDAQKVGGTVDVTVTGPAGTSPISPADEFTYLVSSSTYSISLVAGTTAPAVGASVTLTAIANVDVGPTPYGMSIVDASTGVIVSRVGFGMTFSATVSQSTAMTQRYVAEIDNAGGVNIQANSSPVIVTWGGTPPPAPTVSNVNPATGPASGGTPVTVTGTNFAAGNTVAFGGSAATGVVVNSPTSITADAPSGSGVVDVIVTGPGGTSATSTADQFTYGPPAAGAPTVSAVSPASGPASGGTTVTVTGTNFAAGNTVAFGGSAATGVVVNSPTSITADAPPGDAQKVGGTVDVTVTGPAGTSPISPADEFTYLVSSSTYSISLVAGTTAPAVGASVTLTAIANVDVGPTPYGMSIVDASTGVIVSRVGFGVDLQCHRVSVHGHDAALRG